MRFDEFARSAARPSPLAEVSDFGQNPGNLRMFLYVPPASGPLPLVVTLHGCGQTAAGYAEGAGWITLARRLGFAVLAPEQKTANNPSTCFNWFQPGDARRDTGEAASIRQMIAHAFESATLDPARVFVTGLSAGGAMAGVMLAAYPELFAGGAIIAGLPFGGAATVPDALALMRQPLERRAGDWGAAVRSASEHDGPWPRIAIWHGDADLVVHPANAEASLAQWLNVHGLDPRAVQREVRDGHVTRRWLDASGKPVVETVMVAGLAHGVPIGRGVGTPAPYILESGLSSSQKVAQFWGLVPERQPGKVTVPPPVPPSPPAAPPPDPAPGVATLKDVFRRFLGTVLKGG